MDILIIEEEPLAHSSLVQIIQSTYPDANIWHSRGSSNELIEHGAHRPALAIMDIDASKRPGISNVKKLRSVFKTQAILIVSSADEQEYALPFIKAGANGFISKKASADEFRDALETILAGRKYLGKRVWEVVMENTIEGRDQVVNPLKILSAREKRVLALMIEGNTAKEIATLLNVRAATIKSDKIHLQEKLHAKNLKDLIKKAALFY